jgi:hypothetical protein
MKHKVIHNCKCGETDSTKFYKYRTYECKTCISRKNKDNSNSRRRCSCGECDPLMFYKRRCSKCKKCTREDRKQEYKNIMSDDAKRLTKIEYNIAYQKANIFKYRLTSAKRRAMDWDREFDLDENYLKELFKYQNGCCCYSGIPFDIDDKNFTWSIDRVNSVKGYTKDNVVLCTNIMNIMKGSLTIEEFLTISKKFIEYQNHITGF